MSTLPEWSSSLAGSRILIVDDVEDNRVVFDRNLRRAWFRTTLCADGAEAIAHVSADPPDLVLLDWMMPGLSGMDTLQAIREHYDPNQLPVIMCTARDEESSIIGAIDAGANDYVQKPIKVPVLLARIIAQLMRKVAVEQLDALNRDLEQTLAQRTRELFASQSQKEGPVK